METAHRNRTTDLAEGLNGGQQPDLYFGSLGFSFQSGVTIPYMRILWFYSVAPATYWDANLFKLGRSRFLLCPLRFGVNPSLFQSVLYRQYEQITATLKKLKIINRYNNVDVSKI